MADDGTGTHGERTSVQADTVAWGLPTAPYPVILPRPGEDEYLVSCGCGFQEGSIVGYRPAYDVAERHLTSHSGPPRTEFPLGPGSVGGRLAIDPDAGADAIRAARLITGAFEQWCEGGWEDGLHDPEALDVFLDGMEGEDRAAVVEFRAAVRTTGQALSLEEVLPTRRGAPTCMRPQPGCWRTTMQAARVRSWSRATPSKSSSPWPARVRTTRRKSLT